MMTIRQIIAVCCIMAAWALACSGSDQERDRKESEYSKGAYSLIRTPPTPTLVQGVDLRALAKHYFGQFEWDREHVIGPWGRQVVLVHPSTDSRIEISVGVYSSVAEAEKQALDYLNSMSALFQRANVSELDIGDSGNCWLSEREWGSGIIFLRKNALVSLSIYGATDKRQQIRQLASAIDQNIAAGTMGIELGGKVPVPAELLQGIQQNLPQEAIKTQIRQHLEARANLVGELLKVVHEEALTRNDTVAKAAAIEALGEMRVVEAADLLVGQVHFKNRYGPVDTITMEAFYPCLGALRKIGKPSTLAAVKALHEMHGFDVKGDQNLRLERTELLARVIHAVEGPEVAKFILERELTRAKPESKEALQEALDYLEK